MTLVGILGGGPQTDVLVRAGAPLGLRFRIWGSPPAKLPAKIECVQADWNDEAALRRFASGLSACTYNWRSATPEWVRRVNKLAPVLPPPAALEAASDRLIEKQHFKSIGILTAPFAGVQSEAGIRAAIAKFGHPAILKPRRKSSGPSIAIASKSETETSDVSNLVAAGGIVEGRVSFDRELVCVGVCAIGGGKSFWPLLEIVRENGAFAETAIADLPLEVVKQARTLASRYVDVLSYVGAFCLEFFLVGDNLLGYSFAAGPDFLGNLTLLMRTSHAENHLRAILGMELGPCE